MIDQIVDSDNFSFDYKTGVLSGNANIFGNRLPRSFHMRSVHTDRIINFRPIGIDHPLADPDGWDGEMQIYEPVEKGTKVYVCKVGYGY